MSRCLADRSIDHVVLERGEVANSWKNERWDSLRLLTPNWQSRLPGYGYEGDDPDGFRTMPETIDFIEQYADVISAPVQTDTTVTSVRSVDDGYLVGTTKGDWQCRTVVIASGACAVARVPAVAEGLPSSITTFTPMDYRNPDQTRAGRCARRRCIGQRHSDRRRDPPFRSAGDTHVGRAHPGATCLSWQRHRVVDGCGRRARRVLYRGRQHRSGPRSALASARGLRRPSHRRSQLPDGHRRKAHRSFCRNPRREGAVLGCATEPVRDVRPQDESVARHDRRMGD